jgi:starvation-inducible DNA-binding protein
MPTDLGAEAHSQRWLADMFALYVKTQNFHWHASGPHCRDHHLLLGEQGDQIFATIDAIVTKPMRETHELCDKYNEVATARDRVWIGEAQRRIWFLYEASRHAES